MRFERALFVSFVLFVLSANLVSAYYLPPVRDFMGQLIEGFADIFEPILSGLFGGQENTDYLFEKMLIFLIILCISYISIGFIPLFEENKWGRWIVAFIVPLIGVRFMETEWVLAIIIQYKVLAIVIAGILPFIIYFFFLHNVSDSHWIRKIGWIFFIVVYLGLWATVPNEEYSQIYFWTMVASLIFLLFDGTIHDYFIRQELSRAGSTDKWQHIAKLNKEISDIKASIGAGHVPARIGKNIIRKKEKTVAWLMRH